MLVVGLGAVLPASLVGLLLLFMVVLLLPLIDTRLLLLGRCWWGLVLVGGYLIRRAPKATTGTVMLSRALCVFVLLLRYDHLWRGRGTIGGFGKWLWW